VPELQLHLAEEPFVLWRQTERELESGDLPPPYWAFAWPGGQALARYLLDRPGLVCGRSVLDLGSGSGLVAIAAARAGAGEVTAAEVDPLALAAIAVNAEANRVRIRVVASDPLEGHGGGVDLALAGDLFYEPPLAERVMGFLERAVARGSAVLVGDPGREHLPKARFEVLAAYEVPVPLGLEDRAVKVASVLRPLVAGTRESSADPTRTTTRLRITEVSPI
jgi:predicted nicotinamide N-methyase